MISMSTRAVMSVSACMLLAGVLAGCSDKAEGNPTAPQPSVSDTHPPVRGNSDVPKVTNPLDADPFLGNPCDLVDKGVLAEVGDMKGGEPDVDSQMAKELTGPGCKWFSRDLGPSVSLVIETVHRDNGTGGIKGVYDGKDAGLIARLEPVEVPGHPGYPAAITADERELSSGKCPLNVGIADDLLFVVIVNDDEKPSSACAAAKKVAGSVLERLKGGA